MATTVLPLQDIHLRHWGLTPAIAANNAEAATVCLSRNHTPPTTFTAEHKATSQMAQVDWLPLDGRTLRAWNNRTDTTEMGTAPICGRARLACLAATVSSDRPEEGS